MMMLIISQKWSWSWNGKKGTVVSNGTFGRFSGVSNVIELTYDNRDGEVVADGIGETGFGDTKGRLWSSY
jgi:hypothetical protein